MRSRRRPFHPKKLPRLTRLLKRFRQPKKFHLTQKSFILLISFFLLLIALYWSLLSLFRDLPSPAKLRGHSYPVSTKIFDRYGALLYEIYTDTNRTPVSLANLPPYVWQASLAIEDQNFYHHFGFSLQGIIRALKNTLFNNKLQGGSTITQQLVKTALLENPERTLRRKLREAVLTIATEIRYTKDDILEMYLNHIPYGGTAYGIEAAAQKYFGKPASQLNLAEAALLAGLPQAPSRYSPFTNPDNAKARQAEVLRRLVEDRYIDAITADAAAHQDPNYTAPTHNIYAPHFVFYVKDLLVDQYGLERVEKGGLRVTTTLDLNLQNFAQSTVSAEVADLDRYRVGNGAALITNPATGEILAMVGSHNYFDTEADGQVNLTHRLRQPGSSIKPLNYVTALQLKLLTPSSPLLDTPTCFSVTGQAPYCPKNYDGSSHGVVQFRYALANSYNIPAVKILAINSLDSFIATASAMGISTFTDPSRYGLSLTLGGGEVTMLDMATAFGTLSNQGIKVPLQPILKVEDYTGVLLDSYDPFQTASASAVFFDPQNPQADTLGFTQGPLTRVLNRAPAFLISHILSDNGARTAAFGPNSSLVVKGKVVSVKTGTTNDLKDNWTIGYTPQYLVATWVGNNDSSPMNPYLVSGVTGAAPIWQALMTQVLIHVNDTTQPMPPDVDGLNVCSLSGTYASEGVPCDSRFEYFWTAAMPGKPNIERKPILVFKDTGNPYYPPTNPNTPPADPNLLDLQDHLVISDSFATSWCLDCPYPQNDQGKLQYPRTNVNMSTYHFTPTTVSP